MKNISNIILLLLCFTGLKAQEVSVSPARLFFTGPAGKNYTQQLLIHNTGSEKAIFSSGMMDWRRDSLGNKIYSPPGTLPTSNATWVEVVPNIVEIEAGAKKEVSVILHVPEKSSGAAQLTNSMLFMTQVNAQRSKVATPGKTSVGILVKLEFGIHVYHTPLQSQIKDISFTAMYLERSKNASNPKRLAVKVKNTGNVVMDGFLRLELTAKNSGKELKVPAKALSMLPGDEQVIYQELSEDLQGDYLAVALLDSGEENTLKIAKKDITLN
jgi:hypothetical protein